MNDDNPAAIQQMPDAAATVPSSAQNPAEGVRVRMLGIHSPAQDGQSELTSYLAPRLQHKNYQIQMANTS